MKHSLRVVPFAIIKRITSVGIFHVIQHRRRMRSLVLGTVVISDTLVKTNAIVTGRIKFVDGIVIAISIHIKISTIWAGGDIAVCINKSAN